VAPAPSTGPVGFGERRRARCGHFHPFLAKFGKASLP